jgi:hypothetical protein
MNIFIKFSKHKLLVASYRPKRSDVVNFALDIRVGRECLLNQHRIYLLNGAFGVIAWSVGCPFRRGWFANMVSSFAFVVIKGQSLIKIISARNQDIIMVYEALIKVDIYGVGVIQEQSSCFCWCKICFHSFKLRRLFEQPLTAHKFPSSFYTMYFTSLAIMSWSFVNRSHFS